jgi:hypothetical protein
MSICATGGQGCVIYPELPCTDPTQNHTNHKGYVSKIQSDYNTVYEYSIISYLKKIIPTYVPEYTQYTVLHSITKCFPAYSQAEVQKNCPKCTIPYKNKGTVSMLNMPYKGVSLDKAFFTALLPRIWKSARYTSLSKIYEKAIQYYTDASIPKETIKKYLSTNDLSEIIHIEYTFKTLNTRLINIYKQLITVINKLGIYHSDIKATNLLIDLPNNPTMYDFHHAKIYVIDWGIANLATNNIFNLNKPLCVPLLCPSFMGYFNKYSSSAPVDKIVYTYFISNPIPITPHVSILNESLNILTGVSNGYICGLHPAWFYHMVNCLQYIKTNNHTFDFIKSTVVHNKDTVGMISVYVTIYLAIYYKYVIPTKTHNPTINTDETNYEPLYVFYKKLGAICLQVLINTYTEIDTDDIIAKLTDLNNL